MPDDGRRPRAGMGAIAMTGGRVAGKCWGGRVAGAIAGKTIAAAVLDLDAVGLRFADGSWAYGRFGISYGGPGAGDEVIADWGADVPDGFLVRLGVIEPGP